MSEYTHDLLVHGIAAAKAGEVEEAIQKLEHVLDLDPEHEEKMDACYWLAMVNTDPGIKKKYLEDVLSADPYHLLARREWMILQGKLEPDEIIDPNQIPAPAPDGKAPDLDRFACPKCGGRMVFSPDGEALVCEYCEARKIQQKQTLDNEQDFLLSMATIKGHSSPQGQNAYICKGCGAGFLLANTSLSISCPYCHTVYVVDQIETRMQAAPGAIFPARVSLSAAVALFDTWREDNQVPLPDQPIQIQGIYLPVWWFSLGGEIHYRYQIQEKNKAPKSLAGSQPVLRSDVVVPASKHYTEHLQEMIGRLDFSEMTEFQTDYLADWLAETYQISVADASLKARQMAYQMEKQSLNTLIPADASDISFSSHGLMVDSYQLVLLPAWVGGCSINQKPCQIFIDAINGEVDVDGTINRKPATFWDKLFKWSNGE